jgi:hypothetical protein
MAPGTGRDNQIKMFEYYSFLEGRQTSGVRNTEFNLFTAQNIFPWSKVDITLFALQISTYKLLETESPSDNLCQTQLNQWPLHHSQFLPPKLSPFIPIPTKFHSTTAGHFKSFMPISLPQQTGNWQSISHTLLL